MTDQSKVAPLKGLHYLFADLTVDMKKLETFETEAINDGKKAEFLVKDVEEVYDDWKKILSSTSYLVSEYPTFIGALHQSEKIGSDFKSGDIIEGVELLTEEFEEMYQNRAKFMHSIIAIERWTKNIDQIAKQALEFCEQHDKKAIEKAEKAEQSLTRFWKKTKSKISHTLHLEHILRKKGTKGQGKSTESSEPPTAPVDAVKSATVVVKHISMKEEAETSVSSIDERIKTLVADGDDVVQFIENNKATIEAFTNDSKVMKKDWSASLKAIANVQSIIPLVNQSLDEVKTIGKIVKDAFGAASLNPMAIIAVIGDAKEAWEDLEAIYQLGEKIKDVLESLDILESFIKATMELLSTGRALVKSYQTVSGEESEEKDTKDVSGKTDTTVESEKSDTTDESEKKDTTDES